MASQQFIYQNAAELERANVSVCEAIGAYRLEVAFMRQNLLPSAPYPENLEAWQKVYNAILGVHNNTLELLKEMEYQYGGFAHPAEARS